MTADQIKQAVQQGTAGAGRSFDISSALITEPTAQRIAAELDLYVTYFSAKGLYHFSRVHPHLPDKVYVQPL